MVKIHSQVNTAKIVRKINDLRSGENDSVVAQAQCTVYNRFVCEKCGCDTGWQPQLLTAKIEKTYPSPVSNEEASIVEQEVYTTLQSHIETLEGRIPGAFPPGSGWAIPVNAEKPAAWRIKNGKFVKATPHNSGAPPSRPFSCGYGVQNARNSSTIPALLSLFRPKIPRESGDPHFVRYCLNTKKPFFV